MRGVETEVIYHNNDKYYPSRMYKKLEKTNKRLSDCLEIITGAITATQLENSDLFIYEKLMRQRQPSDKEH